ncbi:hypothetical protein F4859DRAFT_487242 [Xylaria cf. heliscus]|nr:hypothetical protein F4859DRAFT_487242 [Xylaria cf. heliscus]
MVGVAGKSQACNTCRERRLKCDRRQPFCRKCIKAKRECTGYDRGERVFVNRSLSSPSTNALSVLSAIRAPHRLKETPEETPVRSPSEAELYRLFSTSPTNRSRFRKYAVELLEATYLPRHVNPDIRQGSFSWVYGLTDLTKPSRSLDTSLFAFCLSQLHVTGTGNASLYQCLDQYNTGLHYLASDLDDPESRVQEETLAAILVLSTCELFVCPRQNGWSIHANGIAKILRLREPGTKSTPAWRHLITRMRVVCTLEALTKRQGQIILENDIWRQIVNESGFNGAIDEVYYLLADIPTMLGQAVTLSSIGDRDVFLKESAIVAQSMLAMVKSVEFWHDEFCETSPTPRYWSVPSSAANPADVHLTTKVFPSSFEFESLNVAVPIVMCWAIAAQLYSNVIQIHGLVEARLGHQISLRDMLAQADAPLLDMTNDPFAVPDLPFAAAKDRSIEDITSEGTRMARWVCQSLEYFHRTEMGTYGGHSTTYPCWSARQYFRLHPGHKREWSWLENMHKMKSTGTRWGLSMMTFADIDEPLGGLTDRPSSIPSIR